MSYNIEKFRLVKHGTSGITAYCRMCNFSLDDCKDKSVIKRAREHAFNNKHTVDIYRETHTEYTCHQKD